jgi:hypothetical protein
MASQPFLRLSGQTSSKNSLGATTIETDEAMRKPKIIR